MLHWAGLQKRGLLSRVGNGGRPGDSPCTMPGSICGKDLAPVGYWMIMSRAREVDMKFRKRPIVVEAVQWLNRKIVCPPGPLWFVEAEEQGKINLFGDQLSIVTLEGEMITKHGDWIIRGVKGELYPCKDEIFRLTYEVIEEGG